MDLGGYLISHRTGFMPEQPCSLRLPLYYEPWEKLIDILTILIKERRIREEVSRTPELLVDEEHLPTEADWWRAYVVLTFISQGYIWVDGDTGLPSSIPANLAVPWCRVADHFQMPPVVTYACTALHNWALRDGTTEVTAGNMYCPVTFTGTCDEEWFYIVPLLVEMAAAPGIQAMVDAFHAMKKDDHSLLLTCMEQVVTSLKNMTTEFKKIPQKCSPSVFYNEIRPFQAGTKGLDSFPNGLIYEGVDSVPKLFSGASAAQSSTLPAFDTFLDIVHSGTDQDFLDLQRLHMPVYHREFLQTLAKQNSVRDYICLSKNAALIGSYNKALSQLAEFRSQHVIVATRYILMQKNGTRNQSLVAKGTGGSDFMKFLKQLRDNTTKLYLAVDTNVN